MKERIDKINTLKYKLHQNKIMETFFIDVPFEIVQFFQMEECKKKLPEIFELAYKNIIKKNEVHDFQHNSMIQCNVSMEYREFFNIHKEKILSNIFNVFFWHENAYCIKIQGDLLLDKIDRIIIESGCNDIIVVSDNLNFGLCLLSDEHYLSMAFWDYS
ncbi:YxiF family protein [Photorhabdus luminescens]|uniref:YxiF family protein n=1 Tax=Photorhabdus luminescens TaxID=29488 RepID=UPI0022408E53|nr:hypothetical protein [Photorhabdus luminescens]MCW7763897.1 hypothetical protein [Photorhabdus luminescens subsp. venezuelensis]